MPLKGGGRQGGNEQPEKKHRQPRRGAAHWEKLLPVRRASRREQEATQLSGKVQAMKEAMPAAALWRRLQNLIREKHRPRAAA
jgi:hypothetical protein